MTKWSLPVVLSTLHEQVQKQLQLSRKTFGHPVSKGDTSEQVWRSMLQTYLPRRYDVAKAHVVDSKDAFSEQLDIIIFDRQYSPFVVKFGDEVVVPSESVYCALECKQEINADEIQYARTKVASVRKLFRTSLPIPYARGTYPAKKPGHILGGLLTLDSSWKPPLGASLTKALEAGERNGRLDIGCVAQHGVFWSKSPKAKYKATIEERAATVFLLELIARLQESATVPMIDVRAYSRWL